MRLPGSRKQSILEQEALPDQPSSPALRPLKLAVDYRLACFVGADAAVSVQCEGCDIRLFGSQMLQYMRGAFQDGGGLSFVGGNNGAAYQQNSPRFPQQNGGGLPQARSTSPDTCETTPRTRTPAREHVLSRCHTVQVAHRAQADSVASAPCCAE